MSISKISSIICEYANFQNQWTIEWHESGYISAPIEKWIV
jgi:hypothetical protein